MFAKIKGKKRIIVATLLPIALAGFLFLNFQKNTPQGNINPVIEWVLIQLSPKTPGNVGISITIQGYNFTATGNEVHSRGKVLATNLNSVDRLAIGDPRMPDGSKRVGLDPEKAKVISFELPAGVPCSSNEQCPLNVVNANGTSNTVSFRLYVPQ